MDGIGILASISVPVMNKTYIANCREVPKFIYGTAWKEDRTQELVEQALQAGFRGIDTANQRRHYVEAAIGHAICAMFAGGTVVRDDLFIQTKFTFLRGQDHRLPYDPNERIGTQVKQSFASSLEHLQIDWIDSYLLHGPSSSVGLIADDWEAWRAMESIHESGKAKLLGISNVNLAQLQNLCDQVKVHPSFVQNRCYVNTKWDLQVRKFCEANGIIYQGFSLLTANREFLASSKLKQIAANHGRSIAQIIFRFALEIGIMPLTGTSNSEHMRMDLDIFDFELSTEEVESIERLAHL